MGAKLILESHFCSKVESCVYDQCVRLFIQREDCFCLSDCVYNLKSTVRRSEHVWKISVYFPDDFMVIKRDKLIRSIKNQIPFFVKAQVEIQMNFAPLCILYVLQHTYTSRSNFQKVHKMHEWAKSMCDILKILRFLTDAEAIEKWLIFYSFILYFSFRKQCIINHSIGDICLVWLQI